MLKQQLGDPHVCKMKRYQSIVSCIQLLEEEIAPLSDKILPEAFAVVDEAGKRVLGMRQSMFS